MTGMRGRKARKWLRAAANPRPLLIPRPPRPPSAPGGGRGQTEPRPRAPSQRPPRERADNERGPSGGPAPGGALVLSREQGERLPPLARPGPAAPPSLPPHSRPHPLPEGGAAAASGAEPSGAGAATAGHVSGRAGGSWSRERGETCAGLAQPPPSVCPSLPQSVRPSLPRRCCLSDREAPPPRSLPAACR